jgi:hypothetical protein
MTKLRSSTAKYIKTPFLSSVSSILIHENFHGTIIRIQGSCFYMNSNLARSVFSHTNSFNNFLLIFLVKKSSTFDIFLFLNTDLTNSHRLKFVRICFKFILIPFHPLLLRDLGGFRILLQLVCLHLQQR